MLTYEVLKETKKKEQLLKTDKNNNLNTIIGTNEFDIEKLISNFNDIFQLIKKNKPNGLKGKYPIKIVVSNSMGPGIKINLNEL